MQVNSVTNKLQRTKIGLNPVKIARNALEYLKPKNENLKISDRSWLLDLKSKRRGKKGKR